MCFKTNTEIAIKADGLSKCYHIYNSPRDRLKQFVLPHMQKMIRLPDKKYYSEFWALKDVSFEVRKGETVGIIGRNGSGKSTLLQMICGTLNPTSGSILTNGRIAALLELGSGFNPEFSGRDNVYLNGAILGLSAQEIDEIYEDVVSFAEIGNFIDQPVKTYSSGMMLRLAFSLQAQVKPDVLIVDEALAVGDEAFQRKCYARIDALRNDGCTILFVSHSAQTIVQLCDRAILLDHGEFLIEDEPKYVISQYQKITTANEEISINARADIKKFYELKAQRKNELASSEAKNKNIGDCADFYDPSLKSETYISLPSQGAELIGYSVFTLSDKLVNVIETGKEYKLKINVRFDKYCSSVDVGFAIKTPNGLILCGASTEGTDFGLRDVIASSTVEFVFNFSCLLNTGTYFLGFSVFGADFGNDMNVLHRVTDALVLKVAPSSGMLAKGYFDIKPKFTYAIKH